MSAPAEGSGIFPGFGRACHLRSARAGGPPSVSATPTWPPSGSVPSRTACACSAYASPLTELVDEPGHPTRDALDRVLAFYRERLHT